MNTQTILITGASSGIGKITAKYFAEHGWNVAATMRTPAKETELKQIPNIKLYQLDVTDEASIAKAIEDAIKDFGKIDVLINNAGYGAVGIFEKATKEQIQKQFDTNVFGVMNVTRQILPYFRAKKGGTIINVSSMGGRITFPLYSVYHATKWALEGWAESLQFEVRQFGVRIKNIEPGAIKTDFLGRSMDIFKKESLKDYDRYEEITTKNMDESYKSAPDGRVVAKTIFKAANDSSFKLRYPASPQSSMFLTLRKLLPLGVFNSIVGSVIEKGFKN
ncbi:SDR family oxidoreductase [Emticicia sp. BO119]|uniref:SDR family oxidoreductase n=1 Tax=Emticicia sp. BO119 TaxID=2757768 RepID=UPI0015F008E6|nr:SDR family oxidoreductase [Emticicia sp. BO119]MBA4851839.1 SDR family oxidoreductase [Emticicia sp. BO119]